MLELRPFQTEALRALAEPGHVICVSPTGSGKSLIYEKLAAREGFRTLLVTPLVALARQQHARLRAAGVSTRLCAGGGPDGGVGENPERGTAAWIVSPETLSVPSRRAALERWKPNFLVVDECHCLWDWGEAFRPAFARLPELAREQPIRRSLWLTATLPMKARASLRAALPAPLKEIGAFALPESLHLTVMRAPWPVRADALTRWVLARREPGIVFASTRENTLRLSRMLHALGKRPLPYHAGMSREERRAGEAMIERGDADVVVATSAFGMGMDYPRLKWVALWQAPPSLLGFAQSIGRVGRAAREGRALALWDPEDFRLIEWTVRGSPRRHEEMLETLQFLQAPGCRRKALASYFGARTEAPVCGQCDFCSIATPAYSIRNFVN